MAKRGRPKKYTEVEVMQSKIDEYFDLCDKNTKEIYSNKIGGLITVPAPIPYTIEGLAVALDLDRKSVLNYEKNDSNSDFFHTIKKAKQKILKNKLERGLMGDSNPAITIFDLKNNHGFIDKKQTEIEGNLNVSAKDLTDNDLTDIIND